MFYKQRGVQMLSVLAYGCSSVYGDTRFTVTVKF